MTLDEACQVLALTAGDDPRLSEEENKAVYSLWWYVNYQVLNYGSGRLSIPNTVED